MAASQRETPGKGRRSGARAAGGGGSRARTGGGPQTDRGESEAVGSRAGAGRGPKADAVEGGGAGARAPRVRRGSSGDARAAGPRGRERGAGEAAGLAPGTVLVLAEKPAVARDLARVLGAQGRGPGCLVGAGYAVTWAIGHLVELPQPHQVQAHWKRWSAALLPMLPQRWPLQVSEGTREQYCAVERLLRDPRVTRVICATDAGREGELIFRFIYERAGCSKPVSRLWISSLTPDAIRAGFQALRPASEYDALAAAARGRACADWLVGMNLSRAYTLASGERDQLYSVGRVQTPTLALLAERELAVRRFVPEPYREVTARLRVLDAPGARGRAAGGASARGGKRAAAAASGEPAPASKGALAAGEFEGVYFDPQRERQLRAQGAEDAALQARRLPADGALAEAIAARARAAGRAQLESVEARQQRLAPPLLYDLTELQRHANRLFGWSAQRTLDLAQALYERAKCITYPRTDSRYLSSSAAAVLPAVVRAIAAPYREQLAPGTGERPLGRRFVDDARVSDHHAIIPTAAAGGAAGLNTDERRLYDLVCRRLLAAWHDDHLYSTTVLVSAIAHAQGVDRYRSSGTRVDRVGWRVLDPALPSARAPRAGAPSEPPEPTLPAGLARGDSLEVHDAQSELKQTRPPRRYNDASLLTAMESAGRALESAELSEAMRECGLGTPATRAAILETLIRRGYAAREQKSLLATDKGIALVEAVHPDVKSAIMTGRWEAELRKIQRGESALEPFLRGIEAYVSEVVTRVCPPAPGRAPAGAQHTAAGERRGARGGAVRPAAARSAPEADGAADRAGPPARSAARSASVGSAASPAAARRTRAAPAQARWVRREGAWLVRAPQGLVGTEIEVVRADGSFSRVRLGEALEQSGAHALYALAPRAPVSAPARSAQRRDSSEDGRRGGRR